MKIGTLLKRFLNFEGRILIITFILILITGCITWNTFFKSPNTDRIRRDYLIEDIAQHSSIDLGRLKEYDVLELEIVDRLDLNGLIALEKYPEATRRVYEELKNYQLFYDVVEEFGPHHTVPVLDYFYDEGNLALNIEQKMSEWISDLFGKGTENDSLSQRQKRLLAILNEIHQQKHNFLARFIYTENGAKRNYVSTTTSALVNFFTGGLSQFNEAVVTRGVKKVTASELIDAGIDVVVLIPFAVWFTRSAKAGIASLRGTRVVSFAEKSAVRQGTRTAVKSSRLARVGSVSRAVWRTIPIRTLFRFRYVKWYVLALAIAKPDLINHAASLIAKAVSVPPILLKTGFWFLILFPALNVLMTAIIFGRFFWRKFKPKVKIAA